ncbi:UNVERIFIED_ORG: helix-turn-helix protein [Burkholderia sp. CF145]
MDSKPMTDLITVDQFCERYGFTRWTYYRMRDRGEGPKEFRAGRVVRITLESLNEWEQAHTHQIERPPAKPAAKKKPA